MRRPKRSTLVLGLVLLLLATVPVLIPLLVTRAGSAPVDPGAVPTAAATVPIPVSGGGSPATPLARAGSLVPTTASPSPTPVPTPTTATPVPAPVTTAASPAPAPTTPPPSGRPPVPTPTDRPTVRAAGADLVVMSVGWLPDTPAAGGQVTFTAVVRNTGTEPTPQQTHGIAFSVDGTKVSWSGGSATPLGAGEERVYTADGGPVGPAWTAQAGDHTVEAWVDDLNRIPEADESDNTARTTLTVTEP